MALRDNLKNAGLMQSSPIGPGEGRSADHGARKRQYFAEQTRSYAERVFEYADNVYEARVQSLRPENFYAWTDCVVRLSDILSQSAEGSKVIEDYKLCYFADQSIDRVSRGAKIEVGEGEGAQIYLVVNPTYMSGPFTSCVIRRCNALWRWRDAYGAVHAEPFAWETPELLSATNYNTEYSALLRGYNRSIMQYSPQTSFLHNNSRVILGNQAFAVRGLVNFLQEYSCDAASVHLQDFELYSVEPTENDNLELGIAGDAAVEWTIRIHGSGQMAPGTEQTVYADSWRCGERLEPDGPLPVSYLWRSSDTSVLTVDPDGHVNAIMDGTAQILCNLAQNPQHEAALTVSVGAQSEDAIVCTTAIPERLAQFSVCDITAQVRRGGTATDETVQFSFSGAAGCFTAAVTGNTSRITCYTPSAERLTVTMTADGLRRTEQLALTAYGGG